MDGLSVLQDIVLNETPFFNGFEMLLTDIRGYEQVNGCYEERLIFEPLSLLVPDTIKTNSIYTAIKNFFPLLVINKTKLKILIECVKLPIDVLICNLLSFYIKELKISNITDSNVYKLINLLIQTPLKIDFEFCLTLDKYTALYIENIVNNKKYLIKNPLCEQPKSIIFTQYKRGFFYSTIIQIDKYQSNIA